MSFTEYRKLLLTIHQNFNWPKNGQEVLFLLGIESSQHGAEGDIQDALSLFRELENRNRLGIDDLEPLKSPFRQMEKFTFIEKIEEFETRRRDFRMLLDRIISRVDEIEDRVISICRRDLAADDSERTSGINDVRTLFKELEKQSRLGPYRLDLIIQVLRETNTDPNLLQEVEEFAKKKKEEEEAERNRIETRRAWREGATALCILGAGATAVYLAPRVVGRLRGVGAPTVAMVHRAFGSFMGAVTAHCSFRRVLGGGVVVSTGMLLRRCDSLEEFARLFREVVLPLGNFLREMFESSVLFTIQAENISALKALWEQYQDGTLQRNLQTFLVTEEIKQLADGQELIVEVEINEQEYKNACLDLMVTAETQEIKVKGEKRSKIRRFSSDSKLYGHSRSEETDREFDQAELQFPSMSAFDKSRQFVEKLKWPVQETSHSDSYFWSQGVPSENELASAKSPKGALLADVLREKPGVIEELALCLDREMRLISNWKHLSRELKVAAKVIAGLEQYADISPTIRLFEHLEITQPELTIHQLKQTLSDIGRTDLCELLTSKASCFNSDLVKQEITSRSTEVSSLQVSILDEIALKLDVKSKVLANWKALARGIGVSREIFKHFERRSVQSPTNELFEYLASTRPQMTLKPLKEALKKMNRNDLLKPLQNLEDEVLLKDVMTPDSELLLTVADKLNIDQVPWAHNWRKLANYLKIPSAVYLGFGDTTVQRKSPTKEMMQSLVARRPDIKLTEIVKALENIQRNDAIQIITEGLPHAVENPDVELLLSSERSLSKEEVLQRFFKSMQLDPASLEQAGPEVKRSIRSLATEAKRSNRLDVFEQLREMTPPGTTGPRLSEQLDIQRIPFRQMRELTIRMSRNDDWMIVAEKLGLSSAEIAFLDMRTLNPFDAVLASTAVQGKLSVGDLYDVLVKCGLPEIADII